MRKRTHSHVELVYASNKFRNKFGVTNNTTTRKCLNTCLIKGIDEKKIER